MFLQPPTGDPRVTASRRRTCTSDRGRPGARPPRLPARPRRARRLTKTFGALGAAVLLLTPRGLAAQDGHYWTEQYGTRAHLLGGLVVGSTQDLSTVYYNPGGLALLQNPSALFAVDAFQYDWVTVGDGGDPNALQGSRFDPTSGIVAVSLPGRWVRGKRLALSLLTRRRFRTLVRGSDFDSPLPPGDPGVGQTASVRIDQDYSEHWAGATWASTLGEGWGIGVTTNLAIRSQRFEEYRGDARFSDAGEPAEWSNQLAFDYWHVRLLWKVGVRYETEAWGIGVTTTTPSIGLYGTGRAMRRETATGDLDGLFPGLDPRVAAGVDPELDASVSSSWAVAGGGHFALGDRTTFHVTSEWFAPVGEHVALELPQFPSQLPGDTVTTRVLHRLESVLNAGVGVQHRLATSLTLFGSFFTDFSGALPSDEAIRTELASWDLYHVTGGVDFDFLGSNVTLGLQYMRGERSLTTDYLPAPLPGQQPTSSIPASTRYNRIKLLIGLSLDLLGD